MTRRSFAGSRVGLGSEKSDSSGDDMPEAAGAEGPTAANWASVVTPGLPEDFLVDHDRDRRSQV